MFYGTRRAVTTAKIELRNAVLGFQSSAMELAWEGYRLGARARLPSAVAQETTQLRCSPRIFQLSCSSKRTILKYSDGSEKIKNARGIGRRVVRYQSLEILTR
jgi:LSD1 subclass zinc finger protein